MSGAAIVVHWHEAIAQEGRTRAKPIVGDQPSDVIEALAALIREIDKAQPRLFLHEVRALAMAAFAGGVNRASSSAAGSQAGSRATPPSWTQGKSCALVMVRGFP